MSRMFVDAGTDGAFFIPNLNADGTRGVGEAIDDLTWAGSMVLTMDETQLSQTQKLQIVRRMIAYINKNFIVEHDPNVENAQNVALTPALIANRLSRPTTTIIGTKFFDAKFKDEFVPERNWDDPKVLSVHVEGTLGYINLLYQTALLTPDANEREQLLRTAKFLLDNITKLKNAKSTNGGIPYSTRAISEIQSTFDSTIATETYRALMGVFSNPDLAWSFIGVREASLPRIPTVPTIPQTIQTSQDVLNSLRTGLDIAPLPFTNFNSLQNVLQSIPQADSDALSERAQLVTEQDLEQYVDIGLSKLSRVERLLMGFSRVKRLPRVQLGESAAEVDLVTSRTIFVGTDTAPYVTVNIENTGNLAVGAFTAIVELRNTVTGERKEIAFPILMRQKEARQINLPIEHLEAGQWRYDISVVPEYFQRDRSFIPSKPLTVGGTTVKVGQWDFTAFMPGEKGEPQNERTVRFQNYEFQLIENYGPNNANAVRFYDEKGVPQIKVLTDRRQGVDFEFGPSRIRVNVSKNSFNEWAIDIGGEEATIARLHSGEEVLTVGVPHKARIFGYIQKGLPKIQVTNIEVDTKKRYLEDTVSQIIDLEYNKEYKLQGHTLVFKGHPNDEMIQIQVTAPDGSIDRRVFHRDSPRRVVELDSHVFIFGNNADGKTVGVISRVSNVTFTFDVTNDGDSPLRYQPELTFYHPLVGEVSLPGRVQYTINPGETKRISMDGPVPADILAKEKERLLDALSNARLLQEEYDNFYIEKRREIDSGERHRSIVQGELQTRQNQNKIKLAGWLRDSIALIKEVQNKHLVQEAFIAYRLDLNARIAQLQSLISKIEDPKLSQEEYGVLSIQIIHTMNIVMGDLNDLSTQKMGYKISIHDVSNLLGEKVYSRGLSGAPGATTQQPVIRDVVVEPVLVKTEPQQVRRIGKAEYANVMSGIITPTVVDQRANAYVGEEMDYYNAFVQQSLLAESISRVQSFDLPTAKLAEETALENIVVATSDLDRTQSRDLIAVLFNSINKLKIADQRGGSTYILRHDTRVIGTEKVIYDASISAIEDLLAAIQADDSKVVKSDLSRFLTDLGQFFGFIQSDGATKAETIIRMKEFLKGEDPATIDRAVRVVEDIMVDGKRATRRDAVMIAMQVLVKEEVRERVKALAFEQLRTQLAQDRTYIPEVIRILSQANVGNDSRSMIRTLEREQNGRYSYYIKFVEQNKTKTLAELRERQAELAPIEAYLNLVEEHDRAKRLMDEAESIVKHNGDPVVQLQEVRRAFDRSMAFFLQIIEVQPNFSVITNLDQVIAKINASNLSAADKKHAVDTILAIKADLQKYTQLLERRKTALSAADTALQSRSEEIGKAEILLKRLTEISTNHDLFLKRNEQEAEKEFGRVQDALRQLPADQAIPLIQEMQRLHVRYLRNHVEALERATVERNRYQSIIQENQTLIQQLRQAIAQEDSDTRKRVMTSKLRLLQRDIYEATSRVAFDDWYIPELEKQISRMQNRIAQFNGAIVDLGGTPDRSIFDAQLKTTQTAARDARRFSDNLSGAVTLLNRQQTQLIGSLEELERKYNYTQQMRDVSREMPISAVLKDIHLIHNPESYIKFLQENGIKEIYIDFADLATREELEKLGSDALQPYNPNRVNTTDLHRVKLAGRVIQAANQNGMQVKILIKGQEEWGRGRWRFLFFSGEERPGTTVMKDLTKKLRLFQIHLFEHDISIDGFAVDFPPRVVDGKVDLDNYREARNTIGEILTEETDELMDGLKERIESLDEKGYVDRANRLRQILRQGPSAFTYEYEVFESPETARMINQYVMRNATPNERTEIFKGTPVLVPTRPVTSVTTESTIDMMQRVGSLPSVNHGLVIDWSGTAAQNRQEELPAILQKLNEHRKVSLRTGQPLGKVILGGDTTNVVDLQRNLNALGAVPLHALNLLETQQDVREAYQSRMREYTLGLRGQLDHLTEILEKEKAYRDTHEKVLGIVNQAVLQEGLVLELPAFLQADSGDFDQLRQRTQTVIKKLEQKLRPGTTFEELQELSNEIDTLYRDANIHVRRMRLSLNALLSPEGIAYGSATDPRGFLTGTSSVSLNLTNLISKAMPYVGVSLTVVGRDGKADQRDLLKESRELQREVQNLRQQALIFANFNSQIQTTDLQLQKDRTDIALLRRGVDIASKPDAQIAPIRVQIHQPLTIYIDGVRQNIPVGTHVIKGNVFTALKEIRALLLVMKDPSEKARVKAEGLEKAYDALRKAFTEIPTVKKGDSFIKKETKELVAVRSIDNARENLLQAESLLQQAQLGKQAAEATLEHAKLGMQDSDRLLKKAILDIQLAETGEKQAQKDAEDALKDLIKSLTGIDAAQRMHYSSQLGEVGTSIRLDQATDDLSKAYFNFDTIIHRLFRVFSQIGGPSAEDEFKQFFAAYRSGVVTEGFGLESVLGSGTPYLGIDDSKEASLAAELVGGAIRPFTISLYGGLFNIAWSPLNPQQVGFSMTYRPAEDSIVGKAQYNLLQRHAQHILGQMVTEDRREDVERATAHFGRMIESYQDAVIWANAMKEEKVKAEKRQQAAKDDLTRAELFLKNQQFELQRAEENLRSKQLGKIAAEASVDEIEREAADKITPAEGQGEFLNQGQPKVIDEAVDTTIDQKRDLSDAEIREQRVSSVLARLFYAVAGFILGLFTLDRNKRLFTRWKLSKQREAVQKGEGKRKGIMAALVQDFTFDRVTISKIIPFSGRRIVEMAKNQAQFKRVARLMRRYGVDSMAVVAEELKDAGKFVEEERLTYGSLFRSEKIKNLSLKQRWQYRTRLFLRLFRAQYDDLISSGKFKIFWGLLTIGLGVFVFPVVGFPTLPLKLLFSIPMLWGGDPLLSPILFLSDPTMILPWFFWVPFLYVLPRLLYNLVVMIPVTRSVLALLMFVGKGVAEYLGKKALFVMVPFLPVAALFQKVVNGIFRRELISIRTFENAVEKAGQSIKKQTVSAIPKPIREAFDIRERRAGTGPEFSRQFSENAVALARQWAEENGLGPLEQMKKADAQKLINSFIIQETIKQTKHIVFQDEGNALRVNVGAEADELAISPGQFASMPAIYVPFFLPTKGHFNKWFWGIMIQNFTQSLQYAASMGARGLRGAERGANAKHKMFSHIVSKSELDIHSFLFMVQPRWLVGHLHVVREELVGG
ncbi:hypothetical protein KDK77_05100, partial [bacterium]|nr:hypothetical protein [bacterium]